MEEKENHSLSQLGEQGRVFIRTVDSNSDCILRGSRPLPARCPPPAEGPCSRPGRCRRRWGSRACWRVSQPERSPRWREWSPGRTPPSRCLSSTAPRWPRPPGARWCHLCRQRVGGLRLAGWSIRNPRCRSGLAGGHLGRRPHSWSFPPSTAWRCRRWWCQRSRPSSDLVVVQGKVEIFFVVFIFFYTDLDHQMIPKRGFAARFMRFILLLNCFF